MDPNDCHRYCGLTWNYLHFSSEPELAISMDSVSKTNREGELALKLAARRLMALLRGG